MSLKSTSFKISSMNYNHRTGLQTIHPNQVSLMSGEITVEQSTSKSDGTSKAPEHVHGLRVCRHFLPINKNVDREWVVRQFEKTGKRLADEAINERRKELDEIRQEICKYARRKIQRYFVEAFAEEGITTIFSMDEMKKWWKINCETEYGKRIMFHVQYGYFEHRQDWEKVLESQYMTEKGLVYVEKTNEDRSKKGCIAKIISREKTEQVKRFQRLRSAIGMSLTKKRRNDNSDKKRRRRKKGEFCVVTIQGSGVVSDLTGSDEKAVEQMEDIVSVAVRRTGLVSEETIQMILDEIKLVKSEKRITTPNNGIEGETELVQI